MEKLEHKSIWEALSAFQGELKPIPQNGKVDFTTKAGERVKYSYSTLGDIMEVIYPILGKNGLSVRHTITGNEIECFVFFKDGMSISSGKLMVDAKQSDMKEVAGQITYAKRYTLAMVLGLATEEDKDAQYIQDNAKQTNNFAYTQIKKGLENSKSQKHLAEQIKFLESELLTANDFIEKKSEKKPSLGLAPQQYLELLEIAKARAGLLPATDND